METSQIDEMFGRNEFDYAKPENLIKSILEVATAENDLVLDFFLGSGTTCAVAHKMNRRYIGIDQMDYIEHLAVERLKKVINGDQGGISEDVNWQGGGSFVYCKLAKLNQKYVDRIETATEASELVELWNEMKENAFVSYKVNPKDIDDAITNFEALSLDEQKHLLMELLDKNQLYVNYCDMDDETFAISESDKAFTKSFYEGV